MLAVGADLRRRRLRWQLRHAGPGARQDIQTRRARGRRRRHQAAGRGGLGAIRGDRRQRHRRSRAVRDRRADVDGARRCSRIEFVDHARRQHVRLASGRRTSSRSSSVPYKPLLDAKVAFYAALGNHDDPNQRYYKPFNMGGKRYYTYQKQGRALLRPRQQLHGPGPARLARAASSTQRELEMEDRLLPSPDLFVGRPSRIGSGPALASSSRCSSSTA